MRVSLVQGCHAVKAHAIEDTCNFYLHLPYKYSFIFPTILRAKLIFPAIHYNRMKNDGVMMILP